MKSPTRASSIGLEPVLLASTVLDVASAFAAGSDCC